MADLKEALKWTFWGLAGSLWLYCSYFNLPDHTRTHLAICGIIATSFSIANLTHLLRKSSRPRKTSGGSTHQEGLGQVQKENFVSAPAERGSYSGQGGSPAPEPPPIEVRIRPAEDREPLRDPAL